jgi:hypothetical protein
METHNYFGFHQRIQGKVHGLLNYHLRQNVLQNVYNKLYSLNSELDGKAEYGTGKTVSVC